MAVGVGAGAVTVGVAAGVGVGPGAGVGVALGAGVAVGVVVGVGVAVRVGVGAGVAATCPGLVVCTECDAGTVTAGVSTGSAPGDEGSCVRAVCGRLLPAGDTAAARDWGVCSAAPGLDGGPVGLACVPGTCPAARGPRPIGRPMTVARGAAGRWPAVSTSATVISPAQSTTATIIWAGRRRSADLIEAGFRCRP